MTKLFGSVIASLIVTTASIGYVVLRPPPIISPLADEQPTNAQVLSMTTVATPLPSPTPTPTPNPSPTPTPRPTPKPTPTPKPLPTPATAGQMDGWFTQYANSQSVSIEMLRKIAVCESGYKQFATNGIYGGLFQFSSNTWKSTRTQMNSDSNPDLRFNAEEAIKTAAFRFATAGYTAWPNCSK